MTDSINSLIPTRSREVVVFRFVQVPTQEGMAYLFIAMDVFSQFLFQTGVEDHMNEQVFFKHVKRLMKDPDFKKHGKKPFALVIGQFEELDQKIAQLIRPKGGRVVVNQQFVDEQTKDVLHHFGV